MSLNKIIRAIIVEDEMLAREKIRTLLANEIDIEVVDECKDAFDAIGKIKSMKPDLIFLDIQMPGMDGFEMIRNLKMKTLPAIIFTTAFNKYAIKAFDIFALDYLLKPFDKERFYKSINRAKEQILNKSKDDNSEKILSLLKDMTQKENNRRYVDRMVIKSSGRIFFVKTNEINRIEAEGNYLRIYTEDESHLIRNTMNSIEKKLSPDVFIRIHRSIIININFIKEFKPWFNGEYLVYLKNGTKLTSSKTYKHNLLKIYNS